MAGGLIALAPLGGVALADDFGPSIFTGSSSKNAIRAIDASNNGVEASGKRHGKKGVRY